MKSTITTLSAPPVFQPIKVELIIETYEELNALYAIGNKNLTQLTYSLIDTGYEGTVPTEQAVQAIRIALYSPLLAALRKG